MKNVLLKTFLFTLTIFLYTPKTLSMTERKQFLNNPLVFINKTLTLNLFFTSMDTHKKTLTFLPDRARRMPQCQFEMIYKGQAPALQQFYSYNVTFKVTRAEKSKLPPGAKNWNYYVWAEYVSHRSEE